MSDGMGRELAYLSSHATNRYFIPNWGSADTYVSLGGFNGCADQLTNWDGTQKVGLGIFYKEK